MAETLKVKVFRFNPTTDENPRYQTYEVPPMSEGQTALEVLEYIYDNIDPSLSFFRSCRRGLCDECTMVINGKLGLACVVEAKIEGEDELTIEPPLALGFTVIKDLITNHKFFDTKDNILISRANAIQRIHNAYNKTKTE